MEQELDIIDIKWAKETHLGGIDFLSQLTEQELTTLIYKIKKIDIKMGSTILFKGEFSNRLFIIKKGRVGVFVSKEGKKEKIVELSENNYFGEISLIQPVPASATIIAQTDSDIFVIDKDVLDELFRNKPAVLETIRKKIEERRNQEIRK